MKSIISLLIIAGIVVSSPVRRSVPLRRTMIQGSCLEKKAMSSIVCRNVLNLQHADLDSVIYMFSNLIFCGKQCDDVSEQNKARAL